MAARDDRKGLMFENGLDFACFHGLARREHRRGTPAGGTLLSRLARARAPVRLASGHGVAPLGMPGNRG